MSRSATPEVMPGCEPWSAAGSGDHAATTVVLCHGFTGNPLATRPLGEVLNAAGFGVEVVRLPGHGTSVDDLRTTRYADWRGAVETAVDRARNTAGVERVVLVGHSMGGTISLDVASARPDDIAGIVAINAVILEPTQLLARLAPLLQYVIPVVPRDLAGLPTDDIARPDVSETAYPKVSARAAQSLMSNLARIRSQLLDLTMPLMVVMSPQDHTVEAHNSDTIVELVGSSDIRRITCDRSYHVPQLDWDRELVEQSVLTFVTDVHGA